MCVTACVGDRMGIWVWYMCRYMFGCMCEGRCGDACVGAHMGVRLGVHVWVLLSSDRFLGSPRVLCEDRHVIYKHYFLRSQRKLCHSSLHFLPLQSSIR